MTKEQFLILSNKNGLVCQLGDDIAPDRVLLLPLGGIDKNAYHFYVDDSSFTSMPLNNIKPILYPIYELDQVIEHNGKRFVPKDVLNQRFKSYGLTGYDKLFDMVDFKTNSTFRTWPFEIVLKLIEWHFAVGLNDEDYVDVNSLDENPYK